MLTDEDDISGPLNNTGFNTGLKEFPLIKFQEVKFT